MATYGDKAREVSLLLDDEAQRRFRHDQILTWINEGQREASRRSECLRGKATISTTADVQSVSVTEDVVRIHEVYWYDDGNQRIPLVYEDHSAARAVWGVSRKIGVGTPNIWWTEGYPGAFTLWFFPTPSRDGTAEMHYYRFSTDAATDGTDDATTVDLPSGWQDVVVPWAVMRAKESAREYEQAQLYKDQFDEKLSGLIDASVRYTDNVGTIARDDWYSPFAYDDFDW